MLANSQWQIYLEVDRGRGFTNESLYVSSLTLVVYARVTTGSDHTRGLCRETERRPVQDEGPPMKRKMSDLTGRRQRAQPLDSLDVGCVSKVNDWISFKKIQLLWQPTDRTR